MDEQKILKNHILIPNSRLCLISDTPFFGWLANMREIRRKIFENSPHMRENVSETFKTLLLFELL